MSFFVMSEDEVRRSRERVDSLRKSESLEDRVAAILMDCSIGEFGLYENTAREKAASVIPLIREECAKIAEAEKVNSGIPSDVWADKAIDRIAAAIREGK